MSSVLVVATFGLPDADDLRVIRELVYSGHRVTVGLADVDGVSWSDRAATLMDHFPEEFRRLRLRIIRLPRVERLLQLPPVPHLQEKPSWLTRVLRLQALLRR